MSKRERIEDLGIIRIKLSDLIDDIDIQFNNLISSKHDFEMFLKRFYSEEGLDDIHRFLRIALKDRLDEILGIAIGDDE